MRHPAAAPSCVSSWLSLALAACRILKSLARPVCTKADQRNHEARRRRRPPPGCRPRRGIRLRAVSFFGFCVLMRRARRDVFVMGERQRQRQGQAQRQETDAWGVGGLRGRALGHIDDPWKKNWEDNYAGCRIGEVGLSLYLLGGILAHDMCCFFDGPRGAGAAQSSSRSPLRRE